MSNATYNRLLFYKINISARGNSFSSSCLNNHSNMFQVILIWTYTLYYNTVCNTVFNCSSNMKLFIAEQFKSLCCLINWNIKQTFRHSDDSKTTWHCHMFCDVLWQSVTHKKVSSEGSVNISRENLKILKNFESFGICSCVIKCGHRIYDNKSSIKQSYLLTLIYDIEGQLEFQNKFWHVRILTFHY